MSDAIIIQTVYIAIGPFFIVESGADGDTKGKKQNVVLSTLGSSAMRGLRLDALSLIRNVSRLRPVLPIAHAHYFCRSSQTTRTSDLGSSKRFCHL